MIYSTIIYNNLQYYVELQGHMLWNVNYSLQSLAYSKYLEHHKITKQHVVDKNFHVSLEHSFALVQHTIEQLLFNLDLTLKQAFEILQWLAPNKNFLEITNLINREDLSNVEKINLNTLNFNDLLVNQSIKSKQLASYWQGVNQLNSKSLSQIFSSSTKRKFVLLFSKSCFERAIVELCDNSQYLYYQAIEPYYNTYGDKYFIYLVVKKLYQVLCNTQDNLDLDDIKIDGIELYDKGFCKFNTICNIDQNLYQELDEQCLANNWFDGKFATDGYRELINSKFNKFYFINHFNDTVYSLVKPFTLVGYQNGSLPITDLSNNIWRAKLELNNTNYVFYPLIYSTSLYLEELLDSLRERFNLDLSSDNQGIYLSSLAQSAGVGRHGRQWINTPLTSVSFTAVFSKNQINQRLSSYISLAVARVMHLTAIAMYEKQELKKLFSIKWPNDLYSENKKAGGALVSAVQDKYVIGIGINLFNKAKFINEQIKQDIDCLFANTYEGESYLKVIRQISSCTKILNLLVKLECLELSEDLFIDKQGLSSYSLELVDYVKHASWFAEGDLLYLLPVDSLNQQAKSCSFLYMDNDGGLILKERDENIENIENIKEEQTFKLLTTNYTIRKHNPNSYEYVKQHWYFMDKSSYYQQLFVQDRFINLIY